MCRNADLLAHIQYRTSRTAWKAPGANMFSKGDKQTVDVDPVFLGKFRFQLDHRFFGRGRLYIAPAIRDAVHVDVHADERFATGDAHD